MAIGKADSTTEPAKEPTANTTPSPKQRNIARASRLLPKELRKRRRAAKLQISAEKEARASLDGASVLRTPPKAARPSTTKGSAERKPRSSDEPQDVQKKDSATIAQHAVVSPRKESSLSPHRHKKPRVATTASTASAATRLHSLYASSALNRKKQKLQIPGAGVPNHFDVATLPMDIVPKSKLAILTSFPYPFLRSNSQIKKQALQRFIAASNDSATKSQNSAVRWHEALHYFMHPATSLPASILLNRASTSGTSGPLPGGIKGEHKREEKAFLTARWNAWQESFRDLYMSFRRQRSGFCSVEGQGGSFYLRSSEFVVCFIPQLDRRRIEKTRNHSSIINLCQQFVQEEELAENEEEGRQRAYHHRVCAVMSQSNARIRKILHHRNVSYSMPYINASHTKREVGEFHLLDEELKAIKINQSSFNHSVGGVIAPVAHSTPGQEKIHGADSLLLFHGHDAVHGLFEFLINRAPMSNQDVPELFALHPFENGTIQSLRVTSFGRVGGSASASLPSDPKLREGMLFRTEIEGFCFPSSIMKLLGVLKDEWTIMESPLGHFRRTLPEEAATKGQDAQVAMRAIMEAVSGAERLNVVQLDKNLTAASEESNSGFQVHQKRQEMLEFSKRRMETVTLTKVESRYRVETTTRTITVRR